MQLLNLLSTWIRAEQTHVYRLAFIPHAGSDMFDRREQNCLKKKTSLVPFYLFAFALKVQSPSIPRARRRWIIQFLIQLGMKGVHRRISIKSRSDCT